jgi:potassium-transporting ATPase KdpC subunit
VKDLIRHLRISVLATAALAVLLGGVYPLIVWALAQGLYPAEANGSLIMRRGEVVGSRLIGQGFSDHRYFHPRPSAAGRGYDGASSGGSNLGPTSRRLVDEVRQRVLQYRNENTLAPGALVPADAVSASASGLDPHISLKNALLQTPRVARARGLREKTVRVQIELNTENTTLKILGKPAVNVVTLNLALDEIQMEPARMGER